MSRIQETCMLLTGHERAQVLDEDERFLDARKHNSDE